MKRRAAILAALVVSIGLHVVLLGGGHFIRDTPLFPNSQVPDLMVSATIRFPAN
jgi:hypothetical protein